MKNEPVFKEVAHYNNVKEWFRAAHIKDIPDDGGVAVLHKGKQIAIFYYSLTKKWYAVQNMCPHRLEMALSRGIIGDESGEPKISCPFHKKNFSLNTGQCLNDDQYQIDVYPVQVSDGFVYIGLPEDF